jgi:hypothetical protein
VAATDAHFFVAGGKGLMSTLPLVIGGDFVRVKRARLFSSEASRGGPSRSPVLGHVCHYVFISCGRQQSSGLSILNLWVRC